MAAITSRYTTPIGERDLGPIVKEWQKSVPNLAQMALDLVPFSIEKSATQRGWSASTLYVSPEQSEAEVLAEFAAGWKSHFKPIAPLNYDDFVEYHDDLVLEWDVLSDFHSAIGTAPLFQKPDRDLDYQNWCVAWKEATGYADTISRDELIELLTSCNSGRELWTEATRVWPHLATDPESIILDDRLLSRAGSISREQKIVRISNQPSAYSQLGMLAFELANVWNSNDLGSPDEYQNGEEFALATESIEHWSSLIRYQILMELIPCLGNPLSLEEGKARSWEEYLDHAKETGHYQWYVDGWNFNHGPATSSVEFAHWLQTEEEAQKLRQAALDRIGPFKIRLVTIEGRTRTDFWFQKEAENLILLPANVPLQSLALSALLALCALSLGSINHPTLMQSWKKAVLKCERLNPYTKQKAIDGH